MSIIYEPKGKAREYSPLAANLYTGCVHGCKYCYAPDATFRDRETYHSNPLARKDVIEQLAKEARHYEGSRDQVLLCFSCDPYGVPGEEDTTTCALEIFLEHRIPVSVLTKAGTTALRDLELYKQFGRHIQIGTTLTFTDPARSAEWEPKAALPADRIALLEACHDVGIATWVSIEPVIDPEESVAAILASLHCTDTYKIGKINNYLDLDKHIDWFAFLTRALDITRSAGKRVYVKEDLRRAAPGVFVDATESIADKFQTPPFPADWKPRNKDTQDQCLFAF